MKNAKKNFSKKIISTTLASAIIFSTPLALANYDAMISEPEIRVPDGHVFLEPEPYPVYVWNKETAILLKDDVRSIVRTDGMDMVEIDILSNDMYEDIYMEEVDRMVITGFITSNDIATNKFSLEYIGERDDVNIMNGQAYVDVTALSAGRNNLWKYRVCEMVHLDPIVVNPPVVLRSAPEVYVYDPNEPIVAVLPVCDEAEIILDISDHLSPVVENPKKPDMPISETPKLPEQPRTPSSPSSGPGGYVEGQPIFPFQPIDGVTLFSAPKEKMQCVSPVKNLDDPKLIEYYNGLELGFEGDFHRALTRSEFVKMIIRSADVKKDEVNLDVLSDFVDINKDSENAIYIAYALERGIISGQIVSEENGIIKRSFRPNDSISRAEASKIFSGLILKNLDELPASEDIMTFSDVDEKNTLGSYIQYSYDNCLLHGRKTRDGQPVAGQPRVFEPFDGITIAETAKVLYNMTHSVE